MTPAGIAPPSPSLTAAVGPHQPNHTNDVLLIQKLLNILIGDIFLGPLRRVPETGFYDAITENAVRTVENQYFFSMADPLHRIQPGDELFKFLVNVAAETQPTRPMQRLSGEMYQLASLMVPGGVDLLVDGKKQPGNIRTYLPDILTGLNQKGLADAQMFLMAMATIRAETSGFAPIDEGISRYNTSPKGTPGRHPFDLYDDRDDLGNTGSPDGASYKGRGFIQLTGRSNYETIGKEIGVGDDLVNNPDKADDADIAAQILAQFLKNHEPQIRKALAKNDLLHARRLVNGGSHGYAEFKSAYNAGAAFLHLNGVQRAKAKIRHKQIGIARKK